MKNRYYLYEPEEITASDKEIGKDFELLLCQAVLLTLKNKELLDEMQYREAERIIKEKLGRRKP